MLKQKSKSISYTCNKSTYLQLQLWRAHFKSHYLPSDHIFTHWHQKASLQLRINSENWNIIPKISYFWCLTNMNCTKDFYKFLLLRALWMIISFHVVENKGRKTKDIILTFYTYFREQPIKLCICRNPRL